MITEQMTEITLDPKATGTCGMVATTVASKRKLSQTRRKAFEINIKSQIFTTVTVTSTLQVPEPETTMVTNDHKDDKTRDHDCDSDFDNSIFGYDFFDFFDIFSDQSNDSNDENDQDFVNTWYDYNCNAEDQACFKNIVQDYYYEYDEYDEYYIDCDEDLHDYTRAGRKRDHKCDSYNNDLADNCKRFSRNSRENGYKIQRGYYTNNRKDDYSDFLVTDYFYDEENFYDIHEEAETDTYIEESDNIADEYSIWGNYEIVNYTYTGSDGDYNCQDKKCCYESDDDKHYYNGEELFTFSDNVGDDTDIDKYCDDQRYDDRDYSDSEYDYSDPYPDWGDCFYDDPEESYAGWGYVSDDLSDPYPDQWGDCFYDDPEDNIYDFRDCDNNV